MARRARRVGVRSGQVPAQRVAEQPAESVAVTVEPEPEVEPAPPSAEELRREREDRLLEGSSELVRHQGLVTEVRDDLLSADAYLRSFTEVTDLLARGGVEFAPIRGQEFRYWVMIAPGQRAEVLAAFAAGFAGQPVYADLLGHDVVIRTVLADELPQAVAAVEGTAEAGGADAAGADAAPEVLDGVRVKGVRIYRPVVTPGRTLTYGSEHGCDLDFWDSAAPSEGAIAAIHEPPFGWWVPSLEADSIMRIGGRDHPAPAAFTRPLLDDVTFPIDAVITWVDDGDPVWRGRRAAVLAGLPVPPATGTGDERFHNRDELRYCLRSIAMYAPWIRHVFLVTDGQQPDWLMAEHPDLTLVPHRELFADPSVLPVFNSRAIESQLHRIPNLAEHFLYFNDDMFLGRPVRPEQFFQGNGAPLVNLDSRVIPPGPVAADEDEYVAGQKNTRALIRREFGRDTTHTLSHVPYPLTRTLLTESTEVFAAELSSTARSVFRSRSDVAPITLAVSRGYLTGRVAWGRIGHRYVDVDRQAALEQLPGLVRDRGIESFCLNDGALDHVPRQEQDRLVTLFLQDFFPVAGPFEDSPPVPAARTAPAQAQETDAAGPTEGGADPWGPEQLEATRPAAEPRSAESQPVESGPAESRPAESRPAESRLAEQHG
ncbi:Stealth CR1 domain-containing protein [Kitasatospora sp. NBC_01287]|uniref:stealth family protein n=1 Tax=Kitasatospora sp. NBC_01287 TaxID=2903573 RepID=UPI00225272D3|nr:stealth family protein [Kitasatospora sp. NBC_01287]MCX4748581.1 Stealth CR1 domain-containing protein [Kitasatospora sp. NBC_01287]